MNKNMFNKGRLAVALGSVLLLCAPLAMTSCKEDISEDSYAIKTQKTMMDYISDDPNLSDIKSLFDQVKLGKSANASTLTSVLSARGHYTGVAPNNAAVRAYVQKLNGTEDLASLSDEQKKQIALNCIIDNGSSEAYETADFPVGGNTFSTSNLRDRRLSCTQDSTDLSFVINGDAKCVETNIEVSNGYLHIVDHVISPSTNSVAELVKNAANMRIMGKLLDLTGWADSLSVKTAEEEAYETAHLNDAGTTKRFVNTNFPYMEKRAVAYTAFIEVDDAFVNDWGCPAPEVDADGNITNWDAIQAVIVSKCNENFPGATDDTGAAVDEQNFKSTSNRVNRFVAYHLLYGGMAIDEFVHHYNEYGYDCVNIGDPVKKGYSVNVWDYYATMGPNRGLLKVTQTPDLANEYPYYLNRVSKYDDGIKGDYSEKSFTENVPGQNGLNLLIHPINDLSGTTYDNNALNGFYYPIEHVMVYNENTRKELASERIRMDMSTILYELQSQDARGKKIAYFPNDYFANISNASSGTKIYYLQHGYCTDKGSWKDFQGDEFLVTGRFDFVMKLPPVPYAGTYEIRMGASLNPQRTMYQTYFGESPNATSPAGLPIDQREGVTLIPGQPWVSDSGLGEAAINENDRNLRNQGYMKAPNYFCATDAKGKTTVRNATPNSPALRRIITTEYMEPGKSYYLRFKSAIEASNKEFQMDYFEFVPVSIVNATKPEDIW